MLGTVAPWHDVDEDATALGASAERLRGGRFVLAVVGEFSSGKSFLLNALLGRVGFEERAGTRRITGLLATDINPSTATITELSYAREETAHASYANGREERVPIDGLARFVAVSDEDEKFEPPTLVRVGVDSPFLANGFVVADTPGLASINPSHRRATLGYLPRADAVLYLIDTQQPFTDGDASFLGIIRRYIESIFIVQTKIDLWRMGDEAGAGAWRAATARIVAQAAVHAPQTPVFPLSAREYAEGFLTGDAALIAQSQFEELLRALDASLLATTGAARLRQAAQEAGRIAARAAGLLARDADALALEGAELVDRRAALEPQLAALSAQAAVTAAAARRDGRELGAEILARGASTRASLHRTLARAFDVADIARLRDRAKLHILVDQTLAAAMGDFAAGAAELTAVRLHAAAREALARAFGADPATGAWSVSLESGLRGTIVLGALGGPSVSLVGAIAARFAAAPPGEYMKRELLADLAGPLYTGFDDEVARFVADVAGRVERAAEALADRALVLGERGRRELVGALDRAAAAGGGGAAELRAQAATALQLAELIGERSAAFGRETAGALPAPAQAAAPAAPAIDVRFDPQTYEHGLRPERWRVVVIGAFKRGKTSLINALARTHVLPDEAGAVELPFPVHVRFGPEPRVYALSEDAVWDEVASDAVAGAATRTPLLVETPWDLPHQLVLVHTPAFDGGSPLAGEVVAAAAAGASEILVLFSRQLSDRELDLYAELARTGKPISFVHTMADNETAAERRTVVRLADRYLQERAIVPKRIFTVSTRTAGAWNELAALRATLQSHAEEHMERLRRRERERTEYGRIVDGSPPEANLPRRSWVDRILRRSRTV